MNVFQRTFTAQEVALAAGATAKQVSDWCDQGLIIGQREPLGKGRRRGFSFYNVMEVSVATSLMSIGVRAPADAFRAAHLFSHSGDGGGEWAGDDGLSDQSSERLPGVPFKAGETFAFVAGDRSVVSTDESVSRASYEMGQPVGMVVLNLSAVFVNVVRRLELGRPQTILDSVYGALSA
jgi:hypothetical protein